MTENSRRIVVTGIGAVTPYGPGLNRLETGLLEGGCCLRPAADFYPGFAGSIAQIPGLGPLEELPNFRPSRTDNLAVTASREALETARIGRGDLADVGVIMATTV